MTLPELQQSQLSGTVATVIEIGARLERNAYGDTSRAQAICEGVDAVATAIENATAEQPVTVTYWPDDAAEFAVQWRMCRAAIDAAATAAREAETARQQAVETLQSFAAQFELP